MWYLIVQGVFDYLIKLVMLICSITNNCTKYKSEAATLHRVNLLPRRAWAWLKT